ncbi:MAG: O-antigen ligase family protein [Oscillospiraceae bacterium]|nr:O-antigen ligase family protein [Oscillospiraceae bacterium]
MGRRSSRSFSNSDRYGSSYIEYAIFLIMVFIFSMPIISYIKNLADQQRQDAVFINGFFISASLCAALVVLKFITLYFEHRRLGFKEMAKLIIFKNTEYFCFSIYLIWMSLSTFVHSFTASETQQHINLYGLSFKREGLITFSLYVFIFFAASFVQKERLKNFLAYVFSGGAIILAILGVYLNLSALPQFISQDNPLFLEAATQRAVSMGLDVNAPDFEFPEGMLDEFYEEVLPELTQAVKNRNSYNIMLNTEVGVFSNYNHHGYYLAMTGALMLALAVFLKRIVWRCICGFGFLVTYVYIIFLTSIGALVSIHMGMALVFVIYAITRTGKLHKIVVCSGIIIGILAFVFITRTDTPISDKAERFVGETQSVLQGDAQEHFGTLRWHLWTHTVRYIGEKPIFGWGSDGIWYELEAESHKVGGDAQRTHNEYLQQTAFFGIIAGLAYTMGCFMVFWRALRNKKALRACDIAFLSGAFAYLVGAFFGVTMVQVYPMFMAVLGLAVCQNVKTPEKKEKPKNLKAATDGAK